MKVKLVWHTSLPCQFERSIEQLESNRIVGTMEPQYPREAIRKSLLFTTDFIDTLFSRLPVFVVLYADQVTWKVEEDHSCEMKLTKINPTECGREKLRMNG